MDIRVPEAGQIIYYDGIVRYYYVVLEVDGVEAKLGLLGQSPYNKIAKVYDWNFEREQNDPMRIKYNEI